MKFTHALITTSCCFSHIKFTSVVVSYLRSVLIIAVKGELVQFAVTPLMSWATITLKNEKLQH